MSEVISQEVIETFLNGSDPEQYIVGIQYDYRTNTIFKIIQDPVKGKIVRTDTLIPFLWVSDLTNLNFYGGNKSLQKKKMVDHGIMIDVLEHHDNERLMAGYTHLVKSTKGYLDLMSFFREGGIDPWGEESRKHFITLSPLEQYLIQKEKRLFKGFEDYSEIDRLVFDIETTGLDPENCVIILIGVKNNNNLIKIIDAFGEDGEKRCIEEFFRTLAELKPTILSGYNSASFDFPFILRRAEILGIDIKKISQIFNDQPIKMREGMLKLANEVEPYNQYVMWGINILDISHAVRRAQAINSDIKSWGLKYITTFLEKEKENRVYVDGAFISKIYLDNENYYVNPKTGKYKKVGSIGTENLLERYPGKYETWGGQKIVEQYLDDDLFETMVVDDSFSQSTFLLSKVVPTTYERLATMGTATLWKIIMLAWSYKHGLSIPEKDQKRPITGGLSRLLNVGYAKNVVKFDYSSLYPSIQLVYDVFPTCDVMGVQKSMLKYFRNIRIMYKNLAAEHYKTDPTLSEMYNRKQLPIKIFINAYFGSLSAPLVFMWADMNIGETITCVGRQTLRMMLMFFEERGYTALVMDTDGVNFSAPEDLDDRRYVGKGLNELVIKDKVYEGLQADTAEFNDIFMRGEMGLDIDYVAPSTINFARKNYVLKKPKGGLKLTGNTIKSKNLPTYIVEFLDDGLKFLLDGDGHSFIELYYDYVNKIYNKEIPLSKIASKARVKQSISDYKKHMTRKTKSGSYMSKQAHMELLIASGYEPSLGETIYYVNNGTSKSHGDVQKRTIKKKIPNQLGMFDNSKEWEYEKIIESEVKINCYQISADDLINNPNMTGDYNVARYLSNFNKRIASLLVVFHPDIRNDIIVTKPEDREYFTVTQCKLTSGFPIKESGQDSYDEVMTLSDSEAIFWNRVDRDPYFMYLEDSLSKVDQKWVEHNRKVVKFQAQSSLVRDEGDLIDKSDHDVGFSDYDTIDDVRFRNR